MKHVPFWRKETCLYEEDEFCPPKQRQYNLRIVRDLFEREVRRTFRDDANDPELTVDRSPVWTPIPGICHNLELAHSALSRMLRELTGLSAIQTYDKLKLNHLQIPLKYLHLIEQFLHSLAPNPSSLAPYVGKGSKQFWKWLKQERHNPDFDRQALAREFKFPSAARFHRAFHFATDLTPREFENTAIRLAIENPNAFKDLIAKFTPNHDEEIFSPKFVDPPTSDTEVPAGDDVSPSPLGERADECTHSPGEGENAHITQTSLYQRNAPHPVPEN